MAKTKTIADRPMVLITTTGSTWGVERLKELKFGHWVNTDTLVMTNPKLGSGTNATFHKVVNIKEETATTGKFSLRTDSYGGSVILPDGSTKHFWECVNEKINYELGSLEECLEILKDHPTLLERFPTTITVYRRADTYHNPMTLETTKDRKVAKKWFRGKNPLFIPTSQYQQIGIWVEGGTDYVDISYYYNDRLQRTKLGAWKKGSKTGFRLYNDGTISNFYKGKYPHTDDEFCSKRVVYRGLDLRFKETYRLLTLAVDLRSPEAKGALLCQETLGILEKAGFPKDFWCWGNTKRPFLDTYDLVNFATHIQNKAQTKRGTSIEEFLADKPFGPDCDNVLEFNKGVIIRIPGYREVWEANERRYNRKPYSYECSDKSAMRLIEVEVYERYRIWVSLNCKTRSCQEHIHDGTLWSQCRWDNVVWGEDDLRFSGEGCMPYYKKEQEKQRKVIADYRKIVNKSYSKLFEIIPFFKRIADFIKQHPELGESENVRNLLDAFYYAPKLTETLIKIGFSRWFFEESSSNHTYYGRNANSFELRKLLHRFGFGNADYKEDPHASIYSNLGVTKEQFTWLSTYQHAGDFMYHFHSVRQIRIPGKTTMYTSFADIPLKYLKSIAEAAERLSHTMTCDDAIERAINKAHSLMSWYGLSPLDIEKCVNKNLDMTMLSDYLNLRRQCTAYNEFHIEDWDKIPTDQDNLKLYHDRLTEFYNLLLAERERYFRAEEEKRLIECQKNYDKRLKQLKKLAYVKGNEDKVIVVPEKLIELVVEGQVLHHCVGSFTRSVAEGRDTIVFLRNKETPTIPYATIALLQKGQKWVIDQAHTAHNGPITAEDALFLKRWGAQNNVDISSITTHYGARCHH